jgi:hypothetical protein
MHIVIWIIVAVVVLGIVVALFGWDRYRGSRPAAGHDDAAKPTDETFIDPVTGKRMRVWYNSQTGQREYRPE